VSKLLSGRWLLTFVAAIVFLHCAITGVLSSVETKEILMMIVIFYFSKDRTKREGA
jgi:hypothetical protein